MNKPLTSSSDLGSLIVYSSLTHSRLGLIWVAASANGLVAIEFPDDMEAGQASFVRSLQRRFPDCQIAPLQTFASADELSSSQAKILSEAIQQISDYLDDQRRQFDLPIDWSHMTPFQERALRLTYAIPYGQTTTYLEIARQLGNPSSARAVGRAQGTNPMPLVIPCHRVVGSDGTLHGYGGRGGLQTKAWLLEMEAKSKG